MMPPLARLRCLVVLGAALAPALAAAQPPVEPANEIHLASTTSTENSGLFAHLLPMFEAATGIRVHVIAVGTGQAFRLARRGDADALLVHDREAEAGFVAEGWGRARHDVMYNDFVLVGPAADPAGVRGMAEASGGLARIARARAPFLSRGDDSGTHRAERRLWRAAGIDVVAASGTWYRETGAGMGATLNTAAALGAYTLTDRATWLAFRNPRRLTLLFEGDARLFNQYGIIAVDPARHPHVRAQAAARLVAWLTGPAGQAAIAAFRVDGYQLFFPNARAPAS